MGQGIEDGYLAAMEIKRNDIFLNRQTETERETGVDQADFEGKEIRDAITGEAVGIQETRGRCQAESFESWLMIPARVREMCQSLFDYLLATGGPEQKTIIFCARDRHADAVVNEMNNLYARWCTDNQMPRGDPPA